MLSMLHLVGILYPHINDDAWSKSLQIQSLLIFTTGDGFQ